MSYLRVSRFALLGCLVAWGVAMSVGWLVEGRALEAFYSVGLISSVLVGPLAANALIAQLIVRSRNLKVAKHG